MENNLLCRQEEKCTCYTIHSAKYAKQQGEVSFKDKVQSILLLRLSASTSPTSATSSLQDRLISETEILWEVSLARKCHCHQTDLRNITYLFVDYPGCQHHKHLEKWGLNPGRPLHRSSCIIADFEVSSNGLSQPLIGPG